MCADTRRETGQGGPGADAAGHLVQDRPWREDRRRRSDRADDDNDADDGGCWIGVGDCDGVGLVVGDDDTVDLGEAARAQSTRARQRVR
eukprot:3608187-Rhodomonas_salina.1